MSLIRRLGEDIDHALWSALCLIKNPKVPIQNMCVTSIVSMLRRHGISDASDRDILDLCNLKDVLLRLLLIYEHKSVMRTVASVRYSKH